MIPALLAACWVTPAGDSQSEQDRDGDGQASYLHGGRDCVDSDPGVYSEAQESCDQRDEDCDRRIDEEAWDGQWLGRDRDGDGYAGEGLRRWACEEEEGWSARFGDCADRRPQQHPGAEEIGFNQVDDDCDPSTPDHCGESAPSLLRWELEGLEAYDFAGTVSPAFSILIEYEDRDGDLGAGSLLELWWKEEDGSPLSVDSEPGLQWGGGERTSGCDHPDSLEVFHLQVGGDSFESGRRYRFGIRKTDRSGRSSELTEQTALAPGD